MQLWLVFASVGSVINNFHVKMFISSLRLVDTNIFFTTHDRVFVIEYYFHSYRISHSCVTNLAYTANDFTNNFISCYETVQ